MRPPFAGVIAVIIRHIGGPVFWQYMFPIGGCLPRFPGSRAGRLVYVVQAGGPCFFIIPFQPSPIPSEPLPKLQPGRNDIGCPPMLISIVADESPPAKEFCGRLSFSYRFPQAVFPLDNDRATSRSLRDVRGCSDARNTEQNLLLQRHRVRSRSGSGCRETAGSWSGSRNCRPTRRVR